MLKVGLTGGIGSGKTTATKVFELLGVPVYISDIESKRLMQENEEIRSQLIAEFGEQLYSKFKLNRTYLAEIIFNNPKALQKVNAIVHPAVRHDFKLWANKQNANYVIQESAILFETGLYQIFDKTICVTAPEELRVARIVKRDATKFACVKARINAQMSECEKLKRADFVIENNGELILPQIVEIDKKIGQLATSCPKF